MEPDDRSAPVGLMKSDRVRRYRRLGPEFANMARQALDSEADRAVFQYDFIPERIGMIEPPAVGVPHLAQSVTLYWVGMNVAADRDWMLLENASWIPVIGRHHEALRSGQLEESERYPGRVWVNQAMCVTLGAYGVTGKGGAFAPHPLPGATKRKYRFHESGRVPMPEVGTNVLVQTVTLYFVGRLEAVDPDLMVLADCSWIPIVGAHQQALGEGQFEESERYWSPQRVNLNAAVCFTEFPHQLPGLS